VSDWRDLLQKDLAALEAALNEYRTYLEHAIPDVILYNYALDVLEHGNAVLTLTANAALGRAAHACTRAAFESCFDALLLVSDPAEYDRNGAIARACELLEHENLRQRRDRADEQLGLTREPSGVTPEEMIEADATAWEEYSPGKESLLRTAFDDVKTGKRWKRHWSGLSRKKIGEAVGAAFATEPGFPEMADYFYGLLSIHSHPRPRTGSRIRDIDSNGRLTYAPDPQDAELTAGIAQAAVRLTRAALAKRVDLFK
jgi:hypothetical protein